MEESDHLHPAAPSTGMHSNIEIRSSAANLKDISLDLENLIVRNTWAKVFFRLGPPVTDA